LVKVHGLQLQHVILLVVQCIL